MRLKLPTANRSSPLPRVVLVLAASVSIDERDTLKSGLSSVCMPSGMRGCTSMLARHPSQPSCVSSTRGDEGSSRRHVIVGQHPDGATHGCGEGCSLANGIHGGQ